MLCPDCSFAVNRHFTCTQLEPDRILVTGSSTYQSKGGFVCAAQIGTGFAAAAVAAITGAIVIMIDVATETTATGDVATVTIIETTVTATATATTDVVDVEADRWYIKP